MAQVTEEEVIEAIREQITPVVTAIEVLRSTQFVGQVAGLYGDLRRALYAEGFTEAEVVKILPELETGVLLK